jgi:RimJ/RimL family protein N-acetyltransferase
MISLRQASVDDVLILFRWANEARPCAIDSEPISFNAHALWFAEKMNSSDSKIWIIYNGEKPVGQVRLDFVDACACVDIFIDSTYREFGFGTDALQLVEDEAYWLECEHLTATVKADNIASQHLFQKAGYAYAGQEDGLYFYVRCINHQEPTI